MPCALGSGNMLTVSLVLVQKWDESQLHLEYSVRSSNPFSGAFAPTLQQLQQLPVAQARPKDTKL
jgi:hypothetical protein